MQKGASDMLRNLIAVTLLALSIISCAAAPTPIALQKQAAGNAAPPFTTAPLPAQPPPPAGVRGLGESNSVPALASADRMIVYTVQLSVEVQDTEKAEAALSGIVAQYKGYIAGTQMARNPAGLMTGTITIRVPAESLDATQKAIEGVGLKVLSRSRSSNDVTDQYTDLNARLTNLQATESELRQLLDTVREKTGKADDILSIYNRLTEIRGQIEQIKGQMNVLNQTSTYATLTVSLVPHEDVQVVDPESWMPNDTARAALHSLVQALQGLATLAIWIVLFFLPLLLVFILPLVILALVVRAILRRRGTRKPALTT
jgi:hypothetical protein